MSKHIVVIGAGIVGCSTAIWLRRAGVEVTLVDKGKPGQGTSYGNAGILAASAVVPVTTPGLLRRAPGMLLNGPLFLRWSYLPRLAPWLVKYLAHANDADTRRISEALKPVATDTVDQHKALTDGTDAAKWIREMDYHFAYPDRAAYEADAYGWGIREEAGFPPEITEGPGVREREPHLSDKVGLLATMQGHAIIPNPGAYVAHLAEVFVGMGGTLRLAEVRDFERTDGRVSSVLTSDGAIACDAAVVTTGVWSKPLMKKLGLNVPLESERGYHVVFKGSTGGAVCPTMMAAGKFVATPMEMGMRCAGVVEFGGLEAGPSKGPIAFLRRQVAAFYPELEFDGVEEWLGHRPATPDSLPLIGEVGQSGIFTGFGHQHIGLTCGAKTGRLIAQQLTDQNPNIDMGAYSPNRFAI